MGNSISGGTLYTEIAMRLRALREDENLSVSTLATQLKMSEKMIESYESGTIEIPVGYLHAISARFGVSLTALLSGEEAHLHKFCLVRKGEGFQVDRCKDYDYKSLAHLFDGRTMEPFQISVPVKPIDEITFNSHPGQEFIYMVKGELEIILDKQEIQLQPGDSLYFDSQIPHALRTLSEEPAEFIDVVQ